MPDSVKQKFDAVEDRANRHNVTFYTIDAAGLRVHSRMPLTAAAIGEAGEENFSRGIADDRTGERTEAMWRDPTAGLRAAGPAHRRPLHRRHERPEGRLRQVNADRRFHYLLAYCVVEPGAGRHVPQDRRARPASRREGPSQGRLRGVAVDRTDHPPRLRGAGRGRARRRRRRRPPFRFSFAPSARPLDGRPGLTSLVAAVDAGVMTFRENPAAAHLRRRSHGAGARDVQRRRRRWPRRASCIRCTASSSSSTPPGRDGCCSSARRKCRRAPTPWSGSCATARAARPACCGRRWTCRCQTCGPSSATWSSSTTRRRRRKNDPAMKRHPLVWNGMLLYPSLGLPISKGARREMTFFLPMLVDPGEPPPATQHRAVCSRPVAGHHRRPDGEGRGGQPAAGRHIAHRQTAAGRV